MSDAGGKGGIQAYKGHSQYIRGRKIRIDLPRQQETTEGEAQTELELTPDDQPQENGTTTTPDETATAAATDAAATQ